ncbi:MAG TPA: hypothetical protein PLJ34_07810 [Hyphomicrobiales bacterium]|nr:hypothetical protein [Kaistiaceae bacterium]HQF31336.1 hypothetical protein [Hyphomicrobiales bacterium]
MPSRRQFLMSSALVALGLALPFDFAVAATRPTGRKVFMHAGRETVTVLNDPDYVRVFGSIFADQSLTIDTGGGAASFLGNFFEADIVYLNVHANPGKFVVGNGDEIYIVDMIRAWKDKGRAPALVIVTGCKTLRVEGKVSFPRAIGIETTAEKRAYIGFDTLVVGKIADHYFRVFLAHWMKPKNDGGYRSLAEARDDARAFIAHIIDQGFGNPNKGKMMSFTMADAFVADSMEIVGDAAMTFPDVALAASAPPTAGAATDGASSGGNIGAVSGPAGTSGGGGWSGNGSGGFSGNIAGPSSVPGSGGSGGADTGAINDILKGNR